MKHVGDKPQMLECNIINVSSSNSTSISGGGGSGGGGSSSGGGGSSSGGGGGAKQPVGNWNSWHGEVGWGVKVYCDPKIADD